MRSHSLGLPTSKHPALFILLLMEDLHLFSMSLLEIIMVHHLVLLLTLVMILKKILPIGRILLRRLIGVDTTSITILLRLIMHRRGRKALLRGTCRSYTMLVL